MAFFIDKSFGTIDILGLFVTQISATKGNDIPSYIKNGNYKGIGFDVIGLDPIADSNCDGSPIRAVA